MKGVAATLVRVLYHDKTELIAATGQDYIPALDWGGTTVAWGDIPDFLESAQPGRPSTRETSAGSPRSWSGGDTTSSSRRRGGTPSPNSPATFSDPREEWVFEEMQRRLRGPWHLIESRRAEFRNDLLAELAWVESALTGRDWLLGAPSLADAGVYGGLSPIRTVGEEVPETLPNVRAWVARVEALRLRAPTGPSSASLK